MTADLLARGFNVEAVDMLGNFDNSFVRELPELFEPWKARIAPEPRLLVLNDELAQRLGGDPDRLRSNDGVNVLVGNTVPDGAEPVAQAYAGHQFGGYSPRLGDGRALLLGEILTTEGRHDLHLKGSGRTPFARGGDGLAAVGPMLREFVMCESMHALGIPTTRALAVVATGDEVRRDAMLPGAVLARVAASHLRVGTFQYAAAHDDPTLIQRLLDYAIARHYPSAIDTDCPAIAFLDGVMNAQATLVAQWMQVGFIHGVMNTDNMSISGETIDYGPCAFMDAYDTATVFSSIDHSGRYAYGNQPQIAQWNLARLAETLLALFDADLDAAVERATGLLRTFPATYRSRLERGFAAKLGLSSIDSDDSIVDDLLSVIEAQGVDFTSFFRSLSTLVRNDVCGDEQGGSGGGADSSTRRMLADPAALDSWLERWASMRALESRSAIEIADAMDSVNPVYVPRNHLVEEALEAATSGDLAPFEKLMEVLRDPFTERLGLDRFTEPAPPEFGRHQTFCGT
jgi:serine/tyrosine/threonine adenylyltransferase